MTKEYNSFKIDPFKFHIIIIIIIIIIIYIIPYLKIWRGILFHRSNATSNLSYKSHSAQHTTHMPLQDMLPHHHITG
jgi:hypothetical protein